jgi:hypothetical protein
LGGNPRIFFSSNVHEFGYWVYFYFSLFRVTSFSGLVISPLNCTRDLILSASEPHHFGVYFSLIPVTSFPGLVFSHGFYLSLLLIRIMSGFTLFLSVNCHTISRPCFLSSKFTRVLFLSASEPSHFGVYFSLFPVTSFRGLVFSPPNDTRVLFISASEPHNVGVYCISLCFLDGSFDR